MLQAESALSTVSSSPTASAKTKASTIGDVNYFPSKPSENKSGSSITLCSNYFPLIFKEAKFKTFFKYAIDFTPELPGDSFNLRRRLYSKARKQIEEQYGINFFNNTTIYSFENIPTKKTFTVKYDEQEYTISIVWTNLIQPDSTETLPIYKKFIFSLIGKMGLIPFKKNFFDKNALQQLDQIEVWPGFNPTINLYGDKILVNIFALSKVIRTENALDYLTKLRKSYPNMNELQDQAKEFFKNCSVLTRYNNDKTFTITGIDFNMTPRNTFETKEGPISFIDYYKKKYNKKIEVESQPLLVSTDKKTKKTIYLIPELCFLTGLTEEMRGNFNFMKQVNAITIGSAQGKMTDCINIVKRIVSNPQCKEVIEKWGMSISETPINLTARKLDPGNMLMKQASIPIDNTPDIDRKVQTEMYSATPLNKWLIAYSKSAGDVVNKSFLPQFQQSLSQFRFPMAKPRMVMISSNRFNDWEKELESIMCPDLQFCLLILPGSRGKGFFYSEIKTMITNKYGVPSQVILEGTVKKDKGLRSVINKILIQICAKTNGEPWVINDLPYSTTPTMMMSFYTYKGILSSCATFNKNFSQYSSKAVQLEEGSMKEQLKKLQDLTTFQINEFSKKNGGRFPSNVFVFREGIAPSDHDLIAKEVSNVHTAIEGFNANIKMAYIVINLKHNLKAVHEMNKAKYTNVPSGTLIDNNLVGNVFEFFLVSQKSAQGISQGTQYKVVYDDIKLTSEKIHSMVYKLCFLYYNWTGGIKTPAPTHYAKKLAFQIGDKTVIKGKISFPKDTISSLFFI